MRIFAKLGLIIALLLSFSLAAAPTDKGFFWKVTTDNTTLYLMGSLHFATADFYPLRPEIEASFTESDTLVVEVDLTGLDPFALQQLIMETGTYPDATTLRSQLSENTWQRLSGYMAENGLALESFSRFRPGLLITTLTSLEIMQQGLSPESGLDLYFLNQAQGNKDIVELETLEQQLSLLIDIDNPDELMLQTLDEFEHYEQLVSDLVGIWQSGDASFLEQLMITDPLTEYPQSREYFDKVYTQRNLVMGQKIQAMLEQGGDYFVVVGAGHLVGETGLVTLLGEEGFKVTRQ